MKWYAGDAHTAHTHEFAKTITTNGGQGNCHPSGLRPYTNREFARLQTLPLKHGFADNIFGVVRRQIGNMVPTLVARALFREITRFMKEADRSEALESVQNILG